MNRAINFNYISTQWDKPATYGDAVITGYKIYVNGVVEAQLGPEEQTYSFTQGSWCKEYVFQVQVRAMALIASSYFRCRHRKLDL